MRASSLFAVAALTAGMALPATASAQATAEVAQELQAGLKAWLSENLRLEDTEVSLIFNGGVDVVPDGDRYLMTIPSATVNFDGEVEMVVDPIEVELVPADQGRFEVSWTVPARYVFTNPRRNETAELTIGSQHGRGLFDPAYQSMLDVDMAWNDIAVIPPEDEGTFALAGFSVVADTQETDPGIFDCVYTIALEGFDFLDNRTGDRINIGLFSIDGSFAGLDLAAYMSFYEEFRTIAAEAEQAMGPDEALIGRMQALVDDTPALMDDASFRYTLTGLDVDAEGQAVVLDETSLGAALTGMAGQTSELTLTYSGAGLAINPAPPFAQYIPTDMDVELGLANIPNDAIIDAMSQALGNMGQMGPEGAVMMAGMALQQAMLSLGSEVQMREFAIVAPSYTVDFQGSASASSASPFGAIANATIIIGKLDQLQQELMASPMTEEPAQMIAVFQTMGLEDVDAQGNPARRFEIELTETGTVLLNGSDMAPILQQMQ